MLLQNTTKLTTALIAGVAALSLTACKTSEKPPLKPPVLSYKAAMVCTPNVKFDNPIRRTSEEKKRKRELRKRMIALEKNMTTKGVACIDDGSGTRLPYAAFEIPTGLEKRVVNAGAKFDSAVIFAAKISTHDENGTLVRTFEEMDYRRLGDVYGVQFSPRETEHFVLIKADPSLIGQQEGTVETGAKAQRISNFGVTGNYSGGTNKRGFQQNFIRTYSYNGKAVVQTVFPKQKIKK